MARSIPLMWPPEVEQWPKGRWRACQYESYVPDPLAERTFSFSGDCAADVADAEADIIRLNATARTLMNTEVFAPLLLRAEASASSRIEGLEVGARRLLEAEAARDMDPTDGRRDELALQVLFNIDAMSVALLLAESEPDFRLDTILRIHKELLSGTPQDQYAGKMRTVRNWLGGTPHNPCAANYVPPPPEEVPRLMEDLAAFCNDDSLPAVAQAAIAHAQFETIHPFVDGNGRTGRALIHVILRRRGLAPSVLPPISLILATYSKQYIRGLTIYRYEGPPDCEDAVDGLNSWVSLFARACQRSVKDAGTFEDRVCEIQEKWRKKLSPVRKNSSVELLIDAMPGNVILTVGQASRLIGRSFRAANLAVEELVQAGILRQINVGKRNRAFEAVEIIDAFTDLERVLASPADDTRVAAPVRPVPKRHR